MDELDLDWSWLAPGNIEWSSHAIVLGFNICHVFLVVQTVLEQVDYQTDLLRVDSIPRFVFTFVLCLSRRIVALAVAKLQQFAWLIWAAWFALFFVINLDIRTAHWWFVIAPSLIHLALLFGGSMLLRWFDVWAKSHTIHGWPYVLDIFAHALEGGYMLAIAPGILRLERFFAW